MLPALHRALFFGLVACVALCTPLLAENIDPDDDASQHAWGENIGWINAEPEGDGGSGIQVHDDRLTGWMWGENIGWISLSCENRSTCATVDYGVTNNTSGQLGGYAWGENVGWISFSCANTGSCATATYGVQIDPATGEFSGDAWGENVGWIRFASTGPVIFRVKTAWRCLAPAGSPDVSAAKSGADLQLSWTGIPGATLYDVVRGDLDSLRASGGDFSTAVLGCAANDLAGTSTLYSGDPAPGNGDWFLVRPLACLDGSYDSGGPKQSAARDADIASAPSACP
jgi:hypothetical protein